MSKAIEINLFRLLPPEIPLIIIKIGITITSGSQSLKFAKPRGLWWFRLVIAQVENGRMNTRHSHTS